MIPASFQQYVLLVLTILYVYTKASNIYEKIRQWDEWNSDYS